MNSRQHGATKLGYSIQRQPRSYSDSIKTDQSLQDESCGQTPAGERATSPTNPQPLDLDRTTQTTPRVAIYALFMHCTRVRRTVHASARRKLLRVHEKCTKKIKISYFPFQKIFK
jgi:hypothetical protein